MKKCKLFLLPLFCLLLSGCQTGEENKPEPETPEVVNNSVLSVTDKTILVDETFTINVLGVPADMTPVWSKEGDSISYEVETNNKKATVKGEKKGESTIKVVVGEKNLTCKVSVINEEDIPVVNNASLNFETKDIEVDETFDLIVKDIPNGMTPTWSLSGNSVSCAPTADKSQASIKGVKEGETTINVVVGERELSCLVSVKAKVIPVVNNASLNFKTKTIEVNESFLLVINDVPAGMTPTWALEGETVSYELASNGQQASVKGIAVGQTTIRIVVGEKKLSCVVTVNEETEARKALAAPVISVNSSKTGLVWNEIEDAEGYYVQINDGDKNLQTEREYLFSNTVGNYTVKIIAKADDEEFNSPSSSYSYEVKETSVSELSFNGEAIAWSNLEGTGAQYKKDDGDFVAVTESPLPVTEDGLYTLHVLGGFDETNQIIYIEGENGTKSIDIVLNPMTQLGTPVITVNNDKNGVTWAAISGAVSYAISINDGPEQEVDVPGVAFNTTIGTYKIEVYAKASEEEYNSETAVYSYEVKATAIDSVTYTNNRVYWSGVVGTGVEIKIGDDGEYNTITTPSYLVTQHGEHIVHAKAGYDIDNKVLYVDDDEVINKKSVIGCPVAEGTYVVEDGSSANTDVLRTNYNIVYYNGSWVPSQAAKVHLEENENDGVTDGNCVKAEYCRNNNSFKFQRSIDLTGSYDTLGITIEGDGLAEVKLQLTVNSDATISGLPITGIYATYSLGVVDASWQRHNISLLDDGWTIKYSSYSLKPSEVPGTLAPFGINVNSFLDFLPYFNICSFLLQKNGDQKQSFIYLDDFEFSNTGEETNMEQLHKPAKLKSEYVLKSDSLNGKMLVNEAGTAADIALKIGDDVVLTNATLNLESLDRRLTITSTEAGKEFVLVLTSEDGGNSWSYVSCTGTLSAYFANTVAEQFKLVEDFSTYDDTGFGYDATHALENVLAQENKLRGAFYCDYYTGNANDNSPVGGANWKLMSSSDYLDFSSTESFMSPNSARLKSSSAGSMRFVSMELAKAGGLEVTEGAPAIGSGFKYLSFAVKAATNRDVLLGVYVYYQNSISKTTQQNNRTPLDKYELTITQGTGWNVKTITLDPNRTYYGYSIVLSSGSSTAYIYVDDICFHNNISPFN